jgi:hypothetical protein
MHWLSQRYHHLQTHLHPGRNHFHHSMNISGTLNVFRLIRDPSLCLPQHTASTFNHLPVPLSRAFPKKDGGKEVDIRAVVLDKDNCFAIPHTNEIHKPYHVSSSIRTLFNIMKSSSHVFNALYSG